MGLQEFRLELLKVIHRHDLTPDQLIVRAKALEAYINSVEAPQTEATPQAVASAKEAKKGTSKKDKDENSILS